MIDISNRVWEKSSHIRQEKRRHVAVMPGIPGSSSTMYFGFCEKEHLGRLCHQNTKTGKYTPLILLVVWQGNMGENSEGTDFKGMMTDASHVKIHPDTADARGGNQKMGRTTVLSINNKL